MAAAVPGAVVRARQSRGANNTSTLFALVQEILDRHDEHGVVADVGCGTGTLYQHLTGCCSRYVGIDIVRYAGFPEAPNVEFIQSNLDDQAASLPDDVADVVCCLETIEHVENPRALARLLARLVKPGGLVVLSTPNQLSLLSKLCLITKNEFVHFQERPGLYPAHLSALLECDLHRIAREVGWTDVATCFTGEGRMPWTAAGWPRWWSARHGWRGRAFSDNVVLSARRPIGQQTTS